MKSTFIILLLTIMVNYLVAQQWLDTTQYPFQSHAAQLKAGKMHYIDEGEGEVILFVHGTPTWSFLYRDFIKKLSKNYRCIAIDHLGFGLSAKVENFEGTPQAHSANLTEFIQQLGLENLTLVVHDFGGPIGLSYAVQHADNIKQIVLFNSWLWETKSSTSAQKINKVINSGLGRFLYLNMNFSPKVLLKKGFSNKKLLSKNIHRQYIKPFPDKASRKPLLTIAKGLVRSSDWYQEQWDELPSLQNKKWLILWGTKDEFITTEYLAKWEEALSGASVVRFDCGHFVQEEKNMEALTAIEAFLN
ncbi:MAG: alpha/beta fold hydrolase [Bacteroidota bacterium]